MSYSDVCDLELPTDVVFKRSFGHQLHRELVSHLLRSVLSLRPVLCTLLLNNSNKGIDNFFILRF